MAYCTQCGKQNADSAKFCTGCGASLKAVQPTPGTIQKDEEYEKLFNSHSKKKNNNRIIIVITGIIILGTACYFLFFNSKKGHSGKSLVAHVDTTVIAPNQNNTAAVPDTTSPGPATSNVVPLGSGNSNET